MKISKRLISLFLALLITASAVPLCTLSASAAIAYNRRASLAFADDHWAENAGDCARFVSMCLTQGGINVSTSSSTALYGMLNGVYGVSCKLTLTGGTSGSIRLSDNKGKIDAGDPVFFYCNTCGEFTHTSLCNGANSDGYCVDYAWNNPHDGARKIITWTHSGCGTNNWTIYSVHIGSTEPIEPEPDLKAIGDDFADLLIADYGDWALESPATLGAGYLFCDIDFDGVPEFITNYCDGTSHYSLNRYFKYSDGKVTEIYPEGPYEEGSLRGIDWCGDTLGVCRRDSKTFLVVPDSEGIYGVSYYLLSPNKSSGKFDLTGFVGAESLGVTGSEVTYQYSYYADLKTRSVITQTEYTKTLKDLPAAGRQFIDGAAFKAKKTADKKTALLDSFNKAWKYTRDEDLPEEVSLLKAENTESAVRISWKEAQGATSYVVYRKLGREKAWSTLCEVRTTYFDDIAVTDGDECIYTVKGKNYAGKSATYNHAGVCTVRLPQPVITASAANGAVSLKWNGANGVNGYYLYRKALGETSWTRIADLKGDSSVSYKDKDVVSGGTYYYTLKSFGSTGTSCLAGAVKIRYLAQPAVTLTNGSGKVNIGWNKITGANAYYVYRKAGSAKSWTRIADIKSGSTLAYADKSVKSGTDYTYTVKAAYGTTYSSYCSGVVIKHLSQPTVTAAASVAKINVGWNKIAGASGYFVYRKAGSEKAWTRIATVKGGSVTAYADKSVKSGTNYTYTVRAVNGAECSSYVSGVAIKYLAAVKATAAVNSSAGITVKWGGVTGASGYFVYRKTASTGWTRIANISGGSKVSYLDKTAKKGITYIYCVRPVSGSNSGVYANTVSCKH